MILISGASSGIGEATARLFAEKGRNLFLIARRADRLSALAAELRDNHQIQVLTQVMDLSDREAIKAFATERASELAKIRVLVNNAGLALGMTPLQEGRIEDWDQMIDINVKGLLTLTRVILPGMIEKREGHVINLGSVAGHHSYANGNVYCATKWAVRAITECLRLDLNGTGVRVTEISPGMVETEFSEVRFGGDKARAQAVYAGMTPLCARDIAEAIVWAVDRPRHVNIQEMIIYPTDQASPTVVSRKT